MFPQRIATCISATKSLFYETCVGLLIRAPLRLTNQNQNLQSMHDVAEEINRRQVYIG